MLTAADLRKMTPEERERAFDAIYAANKARADRMRAEGLIPTYQPADPAEGLAAQARFFARHGR